MTATDLPARVAELQSQLAILEQEVKTLAGRIANRDPVKAKAITAENVTLKARLALLQKLYFTLAQKMSLGSSAEDVSTEYEMLRLAAVDYFKQINLDPELWKNIAS